MKHVMTFLLGMTATGILLFFGCIDPTTHFEIESPPPNDTDTESDSKNTDDENRNGEGNSNSDEDLSQGNPSDTEKKSASDHDSDSSEVSETDTVTSHDSDFPRPWLDEEQGIGSPCTCYEGCAVMGSPVPTMGNEVGCEKVPQVEYPFAELACLRSFAGNAITPKPYFYANGYCTLYAAKCAAIYDPINLLCPNTTVGNYDAFDTCPPGTALVSSVLRLEGGPNGTLVKGDVYFRICAPLCETESDCRVGETDPIFSNTTSEYQCIDKDGVKFCLDPRALNNPPHEPNDYTAVGF